MRFYFVISQVTQNEELAGHNKDYAKWRKRIYFECKKMDTESKKAPARIGAFYIFVAFELRGLACPVIEDRENKSYGAERGPVS